ncbi:MAG: ATP-binding protein [Pseudomonadota bacterium]
MNLTLSQRLSLAFSVLLLACCGASAWLQVRANAMHEKEVVQGLSRGLAKSIALDTQVMGEEGLQPDAVRRLFDQLMIVNPSVEVYLLDPAGRILGHAAPEGHLRRDRVDLEPVRRLLAGGVLPILGDDPRSAAGRKVFSAAVLRSGEREVGYIYVVLLGEEHDRLAARAAASSVLRTTLWSMALVALLGLLAGLMAFRLITRPLRRLTQTMRHFDTGADAAPPVLPAAQPAAAPAQSGRRDEIAVLEQAFHQMGARIGEQWQTVKRLDHERRELVANISHDLRTPLASLHGYLETLSSKDATLAPADRQRYLGIALGQSRKVGKLAQTLFELARLEHGMVEPAPEDFSLSDLIQDVFQKFELQAQERQSRLLATLPPGAALVTADLGMVERVLTNLIDNALRHTPAGGDVAVEVEPRAGACAVTVSDSGPGLAPQLLDQLFRRPFASVDERGGGLGLLIVHRILQLHGSDIVLLALPGRGAAFQFTLPAPRSDMAS